MPSQNLNVARLLVSGQGEAGRPLLGGLNQGQQPTVFRAIVQEVFSDPKSLTQDDLTNIKNGVGNPQFVDLMPPNSILARIINNGQDMISSTLNIVYPFFSSHISLPIQAGETVFVLFEDYFYLGASLGRWISRPHENLAVEDPNFTHSDRNFDIKNTKQGFEQYRDQLSPEQRQALDLTPSFPNGADLPGRYTIAPSESAPNENPFQTIRNQSKSVKIQTFEQVPRFNKRPHDLVLQGGNNTLVVLGTDRIGPIKQPENAQTNERTKFAGTIDLVAGRGRFPLVPTDTQAGGDKQTSALVVRNKFGTIETDKTEFQRNKQVNTKEGDVDFENDAARIYISMGTKADLNFKLDGQVAGGLRYPTNTLAVTQPAEISDTIGNSYIVTKADHLRMIARKKASGSATINGSILIVKEGTQNEDLAYFYMQADGRMQLEGKKIYLGAATNESEPYIKWSVYNKHITELKDQIKILSEHLQSIIATLNTAFASSVAVPFVPIQSLVATTTAGPASVSQTTTVVQQIKTKIDTINTEEAKSTKIFGS
jgi:hypothetical protein